METYSHYFTLLDPNSPQWDAAWKQLILTDIPRILSYADIKLQDPSYSYYQDYYYYDHQILDPNDYPQDDNNDTEENYDDDDDDDHDDHDDTDYGLDSPAPIIDLEEGIHLNGVGKDGHESLCMEKYDAGHSFVTTAGKPYDLVVCLIYLRAYMLASGCVEVESDGTWGWSWHYVRVAYELLWPGEEVRCPWGDDE